MDNSTVFDDVRRLDGERCLCAMFARGDDRETLMALLAFNLELARIPELVSEPLLGQMRLQWWRQVVDDLYARKSSPHPVARILLEAGIMNKVDQSLLLQILDARERDLVNDLPQDLIELESYAGATGGALNSVMAQALGADEMFVTNVARPIGVAWALTGLLRATAFHKAQGRTYIAVDPAQVAAAARACMVRARAAAVQGLQRAVMPVLLPAILAENHLASLQKSAYQTLPQQASVTRPATLFRLYIAYVLKIF